MTTSPEAPPVARYRLPLLNPRAWIAGCRPGAVVGSPSSPGIFPRSSPVGLSRWARPSDPAQASAPLVGLHRNAFTSQRRAAAAVHSAACAEV